MNRRIHSPRPCLATGFAAAALVLCPSVFAQPVPVQHTQGAMHGFLLIRSESGAILGRGEVSQLASGDRVTIHVALHFRDGSLDEETTVFTQRSTYQFVSDHHIQRGPFFKASTDTTVEANGQVTVGTTDKSGKEKVETSHIELPDDIANGMIAALIQEIPPHTAETTAAMVIPAGKGRLVKLVITPAGTQSFYAVAGDRRSANVFRMHIDLGGIAGVIAPILNKQPHDLMVWVYEEGAPVAVREVGQIAEGTPIISIELGGTSYPRTAAKK